MIFCDFCFTGEPGGDCSVGKYCYSAIGIGQFTTAVRARADIMLATVSVFIDLIQCRLLIAVA